MRIREGQRRQRGLNRMRGGGEGIRDDQRGSERIREDRRGSDKMNEDQRGSERFRYDQRGSKLIRLLIHECLKFCYLYVHLCYFYFLYENIQNIRFIGSILVKMSLICGYFIALHPRLW